MTRNKIIQKKLSGIKTMLKSLCSTGVSELSTCCSSTTAVSVASFDDSLWWIIAVSVEQLLMLFNMTQCYIRHVTQFLISILILNAVDRQCWFSSELTKTVTVV